MALLIWAGTVVPLCAETNDSDENSSNNAVVVPPAPQPLQNPRSQEDRQIHETRPTYVVRPLITYELKLILVPIVIVTVVFASIVGVCAIFFSFLHRRNQMLHQTVRMMVEKGVAIPPELLTKPERKVPQRIQNDFRKGWILIGVGFGLICLAMFGDHGPSEMGVVGFVPLFLGVAFLMVSRMERKNKESIES